ncbi:MAG: ATP-binding cassette domain-containing protein [Gemmatimonadaceae bacterium]
MTGPLPTVLPATDLAASTRMLSKRYGKHPAVTNLELQVPVGAVYLLVGANSAGKTTTLKILLDLLRPTAGVADVLGLDPQRHAARVRANVGYVPERLEWGYAWMRVGRLLEHHACYYPAWDWAYARQLSRIFDLQRRAAPASRCRSLVKQIAASAHKW